MRGETPIAHLSDRHDWILLIVSCMLELLALVVAIDDNNDDDTEIVVSGGKIGKGMLLLPFRVISI